MHQSFADRSPNIGTNTYVKVGEGGTYKVEGQLGEVQTLTAETVIIICEPDSDDLREPSEDEPNEGYIKNESGYFAGNHECSITLEVGDENSA